ncbi:MAG: NPCBM/NEW2 domain-containing protein [Clostridia bacterium]|nr:NPCBM/NEW2 domain-containing protein [Clostridia bacterium]
MKKRLQGLIAGVLIGAMVTSGVVFAANTTTLYDVIANGIKIVVDGKKLNPTDTNGNKVEPIIYNGTTYLPVRAVANALGKAVYWDGPNYTVYLGNMNGKLEYPTVELNINDDIGDCWEKSSKLLDNYGNNYTRAIYQARGNSYDNPYEILCNGKYSRFKGTIYVEKGCKRDNETQIIIKADGKTIFSTDTINKTTTPKHFDINITGYNDIQIIDVQDSGYVHIGDAGFYQ